MTAVKSQPHKTAGCMLKRPLHAKSIESKSFSHPTNTNKDLYLLPNNDIGINSVYVRTLLSIQLLCKGPASVTVFCIPVLLPPKLSIPY